MVELNLKSMDNKIILTIGRQFGSGGREIGQRLAKELGIGYYDKELITVAARESGLCEDVSRRRTNVPPVVYRTHFYDGVLFFYGRDVYAL